jgi:hypothetical protein
LGPGPNLGKNILEPARFFLFLTKSVIFFKKDLEFLKDYSLEIE